VDRPVQDGQQIADVAETPFRRELQAAPDHAAAARIQTGALPFEPLIQLPARVVLGFARQLRAASRQHLADRQAEGVLIRLEADRSSVRLLWRHVGRSPATAARAG